MENLRLKIVLAIGLMFGLVATTQAAETLLSAGFETSEGYSTGPLVTGFRTEPDPGQVGWYGEMYNKEYVSTNAGVVSADQAHSGTQSVKIPAEDYYYDIYLHDFTKKSTGQLTTEWWYYLENVDPTGENPGADTTTISAQLSDRDIGIVTEGWTTPYGSSVADHSPDEFMYAAGDSYGNWISRSGISAAGEWRGIKVVVDLDSPGPTFDLYSKFPGDADWTQNVDDAVGYEGYNEIQLGLPDEIGTFSFFQISNPGAYPGSYFGNPDYSVYIDDISITWDEGEIKAPGDANGDGKVTIADFLALQNHFNQAGTWADGDFNDDGQVTIADFLILQNNWGFGTANAGAVPTIPEPVTLALFGLGGLALIRRRR